MKAKGGLELGSGLLTLLRYLKGTYAEGAQSLTYLSHVLGSVAFPRDVISHVNKHHQLSERTGPNLEWGWHYLPPG